MDWLPAGIRKWSNPIQNSSHLWFLRAPDDLKLPPRWHSLLGMKRIYAFLSLVQLHKSGTRSQHLCPTKRVCHEQLADLRWSVGTWRKHDYVSQKPEKLVPLNFGSSRMNGLPYKRHLNSGMVLKELRVLSCIANWRLNTINDIPYICLITLRPLPTPSCIDWGHHSIAWDCGKGLFTTHKERSQWALRWPIIIPEEDDWSIPILTRSERSYFLPEFHHLSPVPWVLIGWLDCP